MTDILDTIDELDEVDELDFGDDFNQALSTGLEHVHTGELLDIPTEMNAEEATEITEAIRATAVATYVLLLQAHDRKAHKALGYDTWSEYVKQEFDMSAQRSYQLLDLGKAIEMLESAAPEGTVIKLTEAQARDIKRELPRITEQVAEDTEGKTPEEAQAAVDGLIDDIREQKKLDDKEAERKSKEDEDQEQEEYEQGLEDAADAILEADRPDGMTDLADDGLIEVDVEGGGEDSISPEDSMNLYNFFNVISTVSALPEPDTFIQIIPEARADEINEQLLAATSWLNRLQTLWELRDQD